MTLSSSTTTSPDSDWLPLRDFARFLIQSKHCGLNINDQYDFLVRRGMKIRTSSFRKLRYGRPSDLDTVLDLAKALHLDPVDQTELLILHGEALLGVPAYSVDRRRRKRFAKLWENGFEPTKGERPKTGQAIFGLRDLEVAQKEHISAVNAGIKTIVLALLDAQNLTITEAAEQVGVGRQCLSDFLRGKKIMAAWAFSRLCRTLQPNAKTLAELRALYVDSASGRHILRLTLDDLDRYYSPYRHRRLTNWLLALAFAAEQSTSELTESGPRTNQTWSWSGVNGHPQFASNSIKPCGQATSTAIENCPAPNPRMKRNTIRHANANP